MKGASKDWRGAGWREDMQLVRANIWDKEIQYNSHVHYNGVSLIHTLAAVLFWAVTGSSWSTCSERVKQPNSTPGNLRSDSVLFPCKCPLFYPSKCIELDDVQKLTACCTRSPRPALPYVKFSCLNACKDTFGETCIKRRGPILRSTSVVNGLSVIPMLLITKPGRKCCLDIFALSFQAGTHTWPSDWVFTPQSNWHGRFHFRIKASVNCVLVPCNKNTCKIFVLLFHYIKTWQKSIVAFFIGERAATLLECS